MPTMTIGSSSFAPLRGAAWERTATGAGAPARSSCRRSASAVGLGWSKTRVAGRRRPVAALTRLRSSTEVSESKPSSLKARPGSTAEAEAWPSTAATSASTRAVSCCFRSVGDRPARRPVSEVASAAASARRTRGRTSARSSAGTGCCPAVSSRSAARSSFIGRRCGRPWATARSNRARPSSSVMPVPAHPMRARSTSPRPALSAPARAHMPQPSETPGSPAACRRWASASRAAFAAA